MKKTFTLLTILAILAGAVSCIEETTTHQYMTGNLRFDVHTYIPVGSLVEFEAYGITEPADPHYKWVVSTIHTDTLLSDKIIVQFPDEPGTFTVKALAFDPAYITSTHSETFVTVDTNRVSGSLQGADYLKQYHFQDARDGRSYCYDRFGNLNWMTENLAWEDAGNVFTDSPVLNHIFGRHYTWAEAVNACPAGWRLPTNADWEDLGKAVNGGDAVAFNDEWSGLASKITQDIYFNGERLWPFSVHNTHTAEFGWNPLPCGYYQTADSQFFGFGDYGMWWSATECGSKDAFYRYIYWDSADFKPEYADRKTIAMSVRCVQDL